MCVLPLCWSLIIFWTWNLPHSLLNDRKTNLLCTLDQNKIICMYDLHVKATRRRDPSADKVRSPVTEESGQSWKAAGLVPHPWSWCLIVRQRLLETCEWTEQTKNISVFKNARIKRVITQIRLLIINSFGLGTSTAVIVYNMKGLLWLYGGSCSVVGSGHFCH